MIDYESFVAGKLAHVPPTGIASGFHLPGSLFMHQSALTAWALRRGRAAIFADTGLGKSRMGLSWGAAVSRYTGMPVLMLAPLAVAAQTAREGAQIDVPVTVCREQADIRPGVNVTNYDRLHKFDPQAFGGVILDESSIIKHQDSKTFALLLQAFRSTPFRLAQTATPAPNDWTELGTHAEFLGICTRQEMLAEFFCHDGGDTSVWRLKGHARELFWRWVCSWGALIRRPSDLGFDGSAYELPPLHLHEHHVDYEMPHNGMLFACEAQTLSERRQARRESLRERVNECAAVIKGEWSKMAAFATTGVAYGLEEGICGGSQAEGSAGPGVPGQKECAKRAEQGSAGGVHENVLRNQSGEVQAHPGAASQVQRDEAQEVRRAGRGAGGCASSSESMARGQSAQAEGSALEAVRDWTDGVQCAAGAAKREVRDLRALGHIKAEHVPVGGSLPQDREGARPVVHELQPGAREVQGRCGPVACGNRLPLEPWLIWCELNDEQDALERHFGSLAFSVRGSDTAEEKERAILGWLAGDRPVMISKPSIMGFGLNFQHCARMAFVGVTDSYEAYYQAVRRCWRFGQKRDVHVHIFASRAEGAVVTNLKRKEREAAEMAEALSAQTRDAVLAEVTGSTRQTNTHNAARRVIVPRFLEAA